MVYDDCKMYGPYLDNKDKRLRCVLVYKNGRKQTISYPKYIIETHIGRCLEENETVHHIDGNQLNNDLSNLIVIDRRQHCYNDVLRNEDVITKCQNCGKDFLIKGKLLHNRNRKDRKSSGYFCSRKCSGEYGKKIQLGLIKPTIIDKIVPNKYRVTSAQLETTDVEVG